MAGFNTTLRSSRATAILTAIDAGGAAGSLKLYNGTRPATGGAVTTLVGTLTFSYPSGTVTNGVYTLAAVTPTTSALNDTSVWGRIVTSAGVFVMDVSVSTIGGTGEVQLANNVFAIGGAINLVSAAFTEGNQ